MSTLKGLRCLRAGGVGGGGPKVSQNPQGNIGEEMCEEECRKLTISVSEYQAKHFRHICFSLMLKK